MSLTPAERTRLIRTTRKLGAMLGDTPTIAISEPSTRPNTPSSSKPKSSLRSHSPPRINVTLPLASTLPSPIEFAQRSPLSPTFNILNTDIVLCPASPTLDDVSLAKKMRMRKIAKLTHTFGQNVPPELVKDHISSEFTRKSEGCFLADYESDILDIKGETDSLSSSASSINTSFEAFLPPGLNSPHMRLSLNLHSTGNGKTTALPSHFHSFSIDEARRVSDQDLAFKRWQLPEASSSGSQAATTRRQQLGWSGEWNQDTMEEIQNKLRKLK